MTTTEQTWPQRRPAAGAAAGLELVIVDVETTGWLPDQAAITEIGAVKIGFGGLRAEFTALVNPGSAIPAEIATLTGITDEMVGEAPPISAVLPSFLAFARGCVLAAHNAPFDIGFLTAACRQSGLQWPDFSVLDTAALARLVLTGAEVPDCRLATLAAYFSARTLPCHRALADARATADVLQGLFSKLATAGVLTVPGIQLPAPPRPAPRRPPAPGPGSGQAPGRTSAGPAGLAAAIRSLASWIRRLTGRSRRDDSRSSQASSQSRPDRRPGRRLACQGVR
ncbi:MAG TPA: exonuclease domain-containing protein [Streptosporangiaceae bacterium]